MRKINDGLSSTQRYARRHPERRKETNHKSNLKKVALRLEILSLLGNCCSNPECPIPKEKMDIRCLQIDHINGKGCKERKKYAVGCYYRHVIDHLEDYQLLCAYCNWFKRFTNNELIIVKEG